MQALSTRSKQLLHALVSKDAFPNGLILYSPSESLRNDTARYLSQALFCPNFSDDTGPCGTCTACQQVSQDDFVDLRRVFSEKSLKIETIREIQEDCKYGPSHHNHLILIIENAHTLTTEAANAFLKTLEEPPENTHFILCCPSPKNLLNTIQSRCHQLDLPKLGPPDPVENWPDYATLCQWSKFERLTQAQPLSTEKDRLIAGLTLWLNDATATQNVPHVTAISETLQNLQYNVNAKLQLENLVLKL